MPALTAADEALVATARLRLAEAGYPADDLSDEDIAAGHIVLWEPPDGPTVRLPGARVEMELWYYRDITTSGWVQFDWFDGHPENGDVAWMHLIGFPFGDIRCRVRIAMGEASSLSGVERLQGGLYSAWNDSDDD